jgi:DNA repair protein RadD
VITLRPYQREAIDALYAFFEHTSGHPLVTLPTGSGKSVIIAAFIQEVFAQWPRSRILVLTHVKELIEQNFLQLVRLWPEAPAGIYSAGLRRRDIGDAITFAGIQSVYRAAEELGSYDLVLIDECHLIPPKGAGMYRTFLGGMNGLNPATKIIGFTATPYRLGHGLLHEGEDALFTDIAYEVPIGMLIEQGHLARLTTAPVRERLHAEGIAKRNGEFVPGALQDAVDRAPVTAAACAEIVTLGADRQAWLLFCAGVRHATHVRDELLRLGIPTALVTGETPAAERAAIINDYRARKLRALVNVDVLTTGFDAPHIDLLALLRPTQSPGLYLQMCGRGMRTAPGKTECLVLDFAGNVARHGPVDDVRPPRAPRGQPGGEAPHKKCTQCGAKMHPKSAYCADCGYVFPEEVAHEATASAQPILRAEAEAMRYDALDVTYAQHDKVGAPPSLRVSYHAGMRLVAREWVCLEHQGYARTKARLWWKRRAGPHSEPPETIDEALNRLDELAVPSEILVDETQQYPALIGAVFDAHHTR